MPPFCQHIFFNAQDINSTSRDKYFMRVRNAGKINLRARYMKPEVTSNRFEISNHFENFLFNHYDNPV